MSTLTEDTISIQSTDNEEEEIIEDDENEDEEEDDENNENEDEINENEDKNKNEEETSDQRPKTSDVWNFVDKETRKCPSCSKIFEKKTGTSSIRTHLKSHGILLIKEKQTTLDSFINKQHYEFYKKQEVFEWIILDMQPFKVVEGEAFRKMILKFDPKYQLPT